MTMTAVIDTNVALDFFVFEDKKTEPLLNAVRSGIMTVITDEACRSEWMRILKREALRISEEKQTKAAAEYDRLFVMKEAGNTPLPHLPLCLDTDDQKFLELACREKATLVISKDKHLLKLAKRLKRGGFFTVLTPQQWISENCSN